MKTECAAGDCSTVVDGIRLEFVEVPPGRFITGGPEGSPTGTDELPGLRRDTERYQLLLEIQGKQLIEGYVPRSVLPRMDVTLTKRLQFSQYPVTRAFEQAVLKSSLYKARDRNLPLNWVSWHDAQQFLAQLTARSDGWLYRLPTEAEWEYVARAGLAELQPGYAKGLHESAWYGGNSGWAGTNIWRRTHPVGQKPPNDWGLYDMVGNVWEWCSDWYSDDLRFSASGTTDPQGPSQGTFKVCRGGSAYCLEYPTPTGRAWLAPDARIPGVGFRVVRERMSETHSAETGDGATLAPFTADQLAEYERNCLELFELRESGDQRRWQDIPEARTIEAAANGSSDEEAIGLALTLRQKLPDYYFSHAWLVTLYARQGRLGESRKVALEGLRLATVKHDVCTSMGTAEWKAGNLPEAFVWWARSAALQVSSSALDDFVPFLYLSHVAEGLELPDVCLDLRAHSDRIRSGQLRLVLEERARLESTVRCLDSAVGTVMRSTLLALPRAAISRRT
jgi:formylglycine-generating enzyme required for sulfatase activity